MTKEEKLTALTEIKDRFDDLWGKCWDIANEYEDDNPEMYEQLSSLAIDSEERMNKMKELIEQEQQSN